VTVAPSLEEFEPTSLLSLLFDGDSLPDLIVLERDELVVVVAFGMYLGEDGEGFLGTALRHIPAR